MDIDIEIDFYIYGPKSFKSPQLQGPQRPHKYEHPRNHPCLGPPYVVLKSCGFYLSFRVYSLIEDFWKLCAYEPSIKGKMTLTRIYSTCEPWSRLLMFQPGDSMEVPYQEV